MSSSLRGSDSGLSPPVRGSHRQGFAAVRGHGSIPARAGEPGSATWRSLVFAVYPRPCGGAVFQQGGQDLSYGLSPPVRGSQAIADATTTNFRSIPARAGEPPLTAKVLLIEGLSPPVRPGSPSNLSWPAPT